jgi:proteasome component ECM29
MIPCNKQLTQPTIPSPQALTSMCAAAGESLAPHAPALAAVLVPEATAGRLWDGKDALLVALGALCSSCCTALAADPGTGKLVSALLSAASRRKATYRAAALNALEQLLTAIADKAAAGQQLPGADTVCATVSAPLLEAVSQHVAAPPPAADGEGKQAEGAADDGPPPPMPLGESLKCLAAAWRVAPAAARREGGAALSSCLSSVISRPGLPWASWLAAVNAIDDVLKTSCGAGGGGVEMAWVVPLVKGLVYCLTHSTVSQVIRFS